MPKLIDKFSKVILANYFKMAPFSISNTFAIFLDSVKIEVIFPTTVNVIIKNLHS